MEFLQIGPLDILIFSLYSDVIPLIPDMDDLSFFLKSVLPKISQLYWFSQTAFGFMDFTPFFLFYQFLFWYLFHFFKILISFSFFLVFFFFFNVEAEVIDLRPFFFSKIGI